MQYLSQAFEVLTQVVGPLCWHRELSLLPLVASLLVMGIGFRLDHWPTWAQVLLSLPLIPLWLLLCYVGATGVADAMDIGSVGEAKFFFVALLTVAQISVAFLCSLFCFAGRPRYA